MRFRLGKNMNAERTPNAKIPDATSDRVSPGRPKKRIASMDQIHRPKRTKLTIKNTNRFFMSPKAIVVLFSTTVLNE